MATKLSVIEGGNPADPPRQLGEHGLALWRSIQAEYDVSDSGGRELLTQACQALDMAESCCAQIAIDGPVIRTKSGLRDHPLCKHMLQARALCARLIRQLGIDCEPVRAPGRPPGGGR